jgi:hypothetical protein
MRCEIRDAVVQFAPKQWMKGFGQAVQNPGQVFSAADQAIANQAAARAMANSRSGQARNMRFLASQPADTVARRLINDGVSLPGPFGMAASGASPEQDLAALIGAEGGRRALRGSNVPSQMHRGNFGPQGFMEAVNTGIATNPYVRRGVLPTAVAGGGLMAGAGVTAGAQQLWALMDFMRAGDENEQRTAQSPLIQQA